MIELIKANGRSFPVKARSSCRARKCAISATTCATLYKRDQQVCKLLLLRLNDEMSRGTTLLDPSDYSVEHVLPQRPERHGEWRRWFPDAEEREACTESLGNLVVVTQRAERAARNQEFARKREIYRGAVDDHPRLADHARRGWMRRSGGPLRFAPARPSSWSSSATPGRSIRPGSKARARQERVRMPLRSDVA